LAAAAAAEVVLPPFQVDSGHYGKVLARIADHFRTMFRSG
jgi:hypothetical protein